MARGQEIEEIKIGGKRLWIDCKSWIDTTHRWIGMYSHTQVGSRVTIFHQSPKEFKDIPLAGKIFCAIPPIGWFCGLAAAIEANNEYKKIWHPDRDIEIGVITTYYNRSGYKIHDLQTTCVYSSSCGPPTLSAHGGFGIVNYPGIGTQKIAAVKTDGTVRIFGMDEAIRLSAVASDHTPIL